MKNEQKLYYFFFLVLFSLKKFFFIALKYTKYFPAFNSIKF